MLPCPCFYLSLKERPMNSLERLRWFASRALTGLLWLLVLLNPAVAAFTGGAWMTTLLISGLLAAVATGCLVLGARAKITHPTIAVRCRRTDGGQHQRDQPPSGARDDGGAKGGRARVGDRHQGGKSGGWR
jgi:hypothetical protein